MGFLAIFSALPRSGSHGLDWLQLCHARAERSPHHASFSSRHSYWVIGRSARSMHYPVYSWYFNPALGLCFTRLRGLWLARLSAVDCFGPMASPDNLPCPCWRFRLHLDELIVTSHYDRHLQFCIKQATAAKHREDFSLIDSTSRGKRVNMHSLYITYVQFEIELFFNSKLKSRWISSPSWNGAGFQVQVEIALDFKSKFKSRWISSPSWNGAGSQVQVEIAPQFFF